MRRALGFSFVLALFASCTAPVQGGLTGVRLVLTYDVELDQLRVEGSTESGLRDPFVRPEAAHALSADGEDLEVLLPDELAGQTYEARVTGLSGGAEVAAGAGTVGLVAGEIVVLAIHLGPPPSCGDGTVTAGFEECDDTNTTDGDGCSADCREEAGWRCTGTAPSACVELCGDTTCTEGQRCEGTTCACDPESCPDGCCDADRCRAGDASSACGAGGQACETCSGPCVAGVCAGDCDATICPDGCCSGATCNPMSTDSCGIGGERCEPCVAGSADACVNGECRCGADAACAGGQRCVAGLCICDDTSCPFGCCDGVECRVRGAATCGVAGSTCVACHPDLADNCSSAGTCQCGAGPACLAGQTCDSGVCRCTPASCTSGCCDGDDCRTIGPSTCGLPGGSCTTCDALTSDGCGAGGSCACGSGPTCATGQRCEGGACVCDGLSCAGCCEGTTCRAGDEDAFCGSGGSTCDDCGGGGCSATGACAGCNATTCPDGCCTGSTCQTASPTTCGAGGGACVSCDPSKADGCTAGGCTCGGGAACGAGQRCVGGACVCDATSCPTGCCAGNVCATLSVTSCAPPGEVCASCNPTPANGCAEDGSCVCGSNPACASGQRCSGGTCVCDATSCPSGCCSGQDLHHAERGLLRAARSDLHVVQHDARGPVHEQRRVLLRRGRRGLHGGPAMRGRDLRLRLELVLGMLRREHVPRRHEPRRLRDRRRRLRGLHRWALRVGDLHVALQLDQLRHRLLLRGHLREPADGDAVRVGGEACMACGQRANNCTDTGDCACGNNPPCMPGQACISMGAAGDTNGTCMCTPDSCPIGCCSGNQCRLRTATTCGIGGEMCVDCTVGIAGPSGDACSSAGDCTCGGRPACIPPSYCHDRTCVLPSPGGD
ncbi:MAG: hypothetical protein R3B82_16145 [Sandaracinaceae bacterium]